MQLNITSETSKLEVVILGIADDFGGTPSAMDCYDPKSRENVINNTFPSQKDLINQVANLHQVLVKYDVNVIRPENIKSVNQIFSRDIAVVIEDRIFLPNIIKDRHKELDGISSFLKQIPSEKILRMPKSTRLEGGDVVLWKDYIFIGYSEEVEFEQYKVSRTNFAAIKYIQEHFPKKKVIKLELNKSDIESKNNALHLDCCFQPIGNNHAILCQDGFKNKKDVNFLLNLFGRENIIEVNSAEMNHMHCNLFSINSNVIISEKNFTNLNSQLREIGFVVEEVPYNEVGKMGGLFRCSTMPIKRRR